MFHRCVLSAAAFLLFASSVAPQTPPRGFPTPPPSLDQEKQAQLPGQHSSNAKHNDLEQAQREADELARVAQTIPADVIKVREGMIPKDAIEKLKQIEKLSKHLRAVLNP